MDLQIKRKKGKAFIINSLVPYQKIRNQKFFSKVEEANMKTSFVGTLIKFLLETVKSVLSKRGRSKDTLDLLPLLTP